MGKKILIATDKFKGSMTSEVAGFAIAKGISQVMPDAHTEVLPIADGGDGFSAVLKSYLHTKTIRVSSVDPLFRKIKAHYEWDEKSRTAIIELAVASGLVLLDNKERNPMNTSTFGTGLVIKHAIGKGAKKVILGIGGSATNDGGLGVASAMGFQFLDKEGNELKPIGASLNKIATINKPLNISKIKFIIACDVNNPLYGKKGAAYVYAQQKGASEEMIVELDAGLHNLSTTLLKATSKNISKIPGSGAAGGVSSILLSYFKVEMKSVLDLVMEHSGILKRLKKTDLLITGEGRIDHQSLQGKVVGALVAMASKNNKPVLLVCGQAQKDISKKLHGIPLISLSGDGITEKAAMKHGEKLLVKKMKDYFR